MRIWNFEEKKNKPKKTKTKTKKTTRKVFRLCFWLNEECPKLLSSLGIGHRRRKTIPLWNSPGEKSSYVWYLQYWAPCDDLVDFKLWAGIRYLFFPIGTAPECIFWKRGREDRSLWASRDGHSSSSSNSPTLLVFRHPIQCSTSRWIWK